MIKCGNNIALLHFLKHIFFPIIFAVFTIHACSTADVRDLSVSRSVQINGGQSHEECVEMYPNNVMRYSFDSSNNVNFNIHYHIDDGIMYPVNQQSVTFWEGIISPDNLEYYSDDQEFFCLMWDNLNTDPVNVTFDYKVNSK